MANNSLIETMKQSYDFWHKAYGDSFLNYPLIWEKAISSNIEIIKRMEDMWKNNVDPNMADPLKKFFDMWTGMIRKSNSDTMNTSMKDWESFWRNATDEQFSLYRKILEMSGTYWKTLHNRNSFV
jgi:hypothetical protein